MNEEKTIFEILTDENDVENIVLQSSEGDEVEFEQVATIPLDDKVYCILHPVDTPEITDDEAMVFLLDEDAEEETLVLVQDEELADRVFLEYYKLCDESDID